MLWGGDAQEHSFRILSREECAEKFCRVVLEQAPLEWVRGLLLEAFVLDSELPAREFRSDEDLPSFPESLEISVRRPLLTAERLNRLILSSAQELFNSAAGGAVDDPVLQRAQHHLVELLLHRPFLPRRTPSPPSVQRSFPTASEDGLQQPLSSSSSIPAPPLPPVNSYLRKEWEREMNLHAGVKIVIEGLRVQNFVPVQLRAVTLHQDGSHRGLDADEMVLSFLRRLLRRVSSSSSSRSLCPHALADSGWLDALDVLLAGSLQPQALSRGAMKTNLLSDLGRCLGLVTEAQQASVFAVLLESLLEYCKGCPGPEQDRKKEGGTPALEHPRPVSTLLAAAFRIALDLTHRFKYRGSTAAVQELVELIIRKKSVPSVDCLPFSCSVRLAGSLSSLLLLLVTFRADDAACFISPSQGTESWLDGTPGEHRVLLRPVRALRSCGEMVSTLPENRAAWEEEEPRRDRAAAGDSGGYQC